MVLNIKKLLFLNESYQLFLFMNSKKLSMLAIVKKQLFP